MQKVAFICVHNSCRIQIAEALGRHLAADIFESYSAGTEMEVAHTFYAQPPRHKHLTNPETKKGADLAK